MKTTLKTLLLLVVFACFFMALFTPQFVQASTDSTSINSALSRKSSERFAPSQLGSGDDSLRSAALHCVPCTRPQMFGASLSATGLHFLGDYADEKSNSRTHEQRGYVCTSMALTPWGVFFGTDNPAMQPTCHLREPNQIPLACP